MINKKNNKYIATKRAIVAYKHIYKILGDCYNIVGKAAEGMVMG